MNKMSLLLLALAKMMQFKAWRKAEFRKKLAEQNFVLQIKTASGSTARYFIFSNGKLTSKRGVHAKPDVALVWKEETIGFATMTNKDPKAMMDALTKGNLKLEGKADLALWFAGAVNMMMKG
jgi:hypothetical protein